MKQKFYIILILTILFRCVTYGTDLPLSDGDRIVIEGDSYADQKKWSCYLVAYWVLMNPSLNLHIQVVARSGVQQDQQLTDPTGYHGYDEYNKTIYPLSPRWVFNDLGDNGGDSTDLFISVTTNLCDNYIVGENGATPILAGPFPAINNTTGKARNGLYEDAEGLLTANRGWPFGAKWHYLAQIFSIPANWPILSTTLNVHVDTSGNILEFISIIRTLGFSTLVANSTIDASSHMVTSSTNATVTNVADNAYSGIDFDRLDAKLPWAYDLDLDGYNKAVGLLPSLRNWQDYSIAVTNLSSGSYNVFCDDVQIGTGISDTTLFQGWNMSDLQVGPVFNQVQEVLARTRDMEGVSRIQSGPAGDPFPNIQAPDPFGHGVNGWRGVYRYKSNAAGCYGTQGLRGSALITCLQPAITEINNYDGLIHAAAQPMTRHYSIRSSSASPTPTPIASPTSTITPTPTPTCTCP